ncbi:hypothetical protein [Actinocrispum sp. NPDC049592]|uniref:hypothetical protein n=1 Tax=Actinocrispum sp. NPDC049592 TaxID=3154835 RepID=UPI003423FD9C
MNAPTYQERIASEPMRRAYQVTYSMQKITEFAVSYNSAVDAGHLVCASAMIDAFYVHIRLLAEFFVKGSQSRDLRPTDFGVLWTTPSSDEADRLRTYWDVASKYVVHFGRSRVPADLADLQQFELGSQAMTTMATDALTVAGDFVKLVEQSVEGVGVGSTGPRPVELMVAEHLRLAFDQACQRIGLKP